MLKKIYIYFKNLIFNKKAKSVIVIIKFAFFNALFIFAVSLTLNVINIIYTSRNGFGGFYYQLKALFYSIFFITTKILDLLHYKLQMNFQNKYSVLINILNFCFIAFLIFFAMYLISFIILKLIFKKGVFSTYYIYLPTVIFILYNAYNFFRQSLNRYNFSLIISILILIMIVFTHLILNYHLLRSEELTAKKEESRKG